MSTLEPSHEPVRICNFTVNVYCPLFLAAKQRWKAEDAPKILFEEMKSARIHCTPEELAVVQPVIKQNGFYGHGENILYSLLSSNNKEDRKFAIDTIKIIRMMKVKKSRARKKIRPFKVPENIFEITDLQKLTTEPPITIGYSLKELNTLLENTLSRNIPSNTLAVEHGVKETSVAAKVSADINVQDGFVFSAMSAQEKNIYQNNNKKVWSNK